MTECCVYLSLVKMGFWDPRSDDDQLTVTSLDFQEELLAVGLHGGATLIFSLSSQSSVIDMKVQFTVSWALIKVPQHCHLKVPHCLVYCMYI